MSFPVVSVLTPVYNGARYVADCIESVLAQSYRSFEYYIVDNCSTDESLEIARSYARKDPRIRVIANREFVGAIENHNRAFSLVPDHCEYCKVVSADDWILPECIEKMVQFAESHRTVGIVCSYQRSGHQVKWQGVPPDVTVMSGREAGRLGLLNGVFVFGTPTSVLYRANVVRRRQPFFPHLFSHADTSACYEILQACDFGFLHEVLSEERVHAGQWTAEMDALDAGSVGYLDVLLRYGPSYLSADEFNARKETIFAQYYRGLGSCFWTMKGPKYWRFHRSRLKDIGVQLQWSRVAEAAVAKALLEARHPRTAIHKLAAAVMGRPLP
jgi:glycosyltransferase involved in cell wall biosynthesis